MKINKISIMLIGSMMFLMLFPEIGQAQYSTIKVRTKHEKYTDSLKKVEYNYTFPIYGQEAYRKGFDIPYPAGVMGNFLWMKQGILIENLELGLTSDNQDIPLTDVGDLIQFGENTNTSYSVNFRPDLFVLPFLNVYGIFGYGKSTMDVNIEVPVKLQSVVDQNISTAGFGIMGAGGVGPIWFSVDANWTWNKPELLDKPVKVNVLGLRFGHTFTFKNNPERNIALWVGGMKVKMNSETVGEIKMIDALPPEVWEKTAQIISDYETWHDLNYDNLNPAEKKIVDDVFDPIIDRIGAADGDAVIKYGMDKQVKQNWNGVIGMQYQFNKKVMIRTEAGLIGDRKSILASINYRFLM
jgi:hypothetical protein